MDISVQVKLECRELTARGLQRWLEVLEAAYGTLSVPVVAKRRDNGEIYLQVMEEVE